MIKKILTIFLLLCHAYLAAQIDSTQNKLSFNGDFRFRVEQDWSSQKSNGTFRDDRTRLRYRARFGATYDHKDWGSFGIRLRTGDPKKQQDPQLTLGDGFKEFSTLPITFEKVYAQFKYKRLTGWVGKNTFPFKKHNELFWSDNVFPKGIAINTSFNFNNKHLSALQINTGHFILSANGSSFNKDSYFQGIQLVTTHYDNKLKLFPSFYYFNKISNIPDGNETFNINYAIMHIGASVQVSKKLKIKAEVDYYNNLKNYTRNDSIASKFSNQKEGLIAAISIGELKKPKSFKSKITYTYLERFAAVDFLAQNDWVRWDYSNFGSKDGRLTNFKGLELMAGYAIDKNSNLKIRCFFVDQIIPLGTKPETGNRIRLDFNIGF